ELQEIDGVRLEVAQAPVDPRRKVLAVVPFRRLPGQPAPGLRRHPQAVAGALAAQAGHETLAAAVAVDVGGVDEVHAGLDGGMKGAQRVAVVDGTPRPADGPGAEADG